VKFFRLRFNKQLPAVFLLLLLLFCTGCQSRPTVSTSSSSPASELTIITSFYPMQIMAMNITRDVPGVKVINLTKPITGCLHDYQMTPDDVITLNRGQIFIVNGADMESFLSKVVTQLPQLKIIEASRGLQLLPGSGDSAANPHVWVSVSGAIQEVQNISEQLAQLDPARADQYHSNAAAYIAQLSALRDRMHQQLDSLPNRNIVTFHEAFPYFAQEFNLNIISVVEREPGSEPSAAELSVAIQQIRQANVKAIFAEPQYPTKAAEAIARETGARVYTLDPAVTGPVAADAYIKIMEANLQVLREALS